MGLMPTQAGASSLSKLYSECKRHFQYFLLALGHEDCRVIHLGQVVLPEILEQYGRFKIWGDQSKADFPERARGSLDDTLRKDEELKSLVQEIFKRLEGLLAEATNIAGRRYDPDMGSDYDSISSVSAESDSSSFNEEEDAGNRMPKICLLVKQIMEQLCSLFDISALLRRPKITDKYIRSIGSEKTAKLDKSDILSLTNAFVCLDECHVVEKALQWRGLTKSAIKFDIDVESSAPLESISREGGLEDIFWLCQRLARANTRRREQLKYWTDHPYDFKNNAPMAYDEDNQAMFRILRQAKDDDISGSQASTLNQTKFKHPPAMPKSISSKLSFSTAAVSDIYETKTDTRSKTVYAPTEIGQNRTSLVPNPPKVKDGQLTFPCPYCGFALDSSLIRDRQSWKRHVFRDLRPYVCTFHDCQNSEKLYVSRRDWIYHELQVHRRRYICQEKDCDSVFSSRKELSSHLKQHYNDAILSAQLDVILDFCSQRADDLNTGKEPCLICGEELSLSALQKHLAAHMEDIALFVLPTDVDQESGDSKASVRAAKLESNGQDIDKMSDTSSLGFSAAGDWQQTPAELSNFLAIKEDEYHSPSSRPRWMDIGEKDSLSDIEAAVEKLESKDWEDRVAAVRALVNQPKLPDTVIKTVTWLLQNSDPRVRCSAVQVLSSQTALPPKTLESMAKRLEDKEKGGLTALAYASKYGLTTSVNCLLLLGSWVDSRGSSSETPLHLAARYGHDTIVSLLLNGGADPNSRTHVGKTPLSGAAENGHEAVVKVLLDKHANPYITNLSGETPMSLALKGEHKGVVKLLEAQERIPVFESLYKLTGDLNAVSQSHKTIGEDWYAVSDPELERILNVELVHSFDHASIVCCVNYSHDARYLATGTDQSCKIFDVQTGLTVYDLGYKSQKEDEGYVRSVCFSPDDSYLIAGCEDNIIRVWDMGTGRLDKSLSGHGKSVYTLDITQQGNIFASGSADGKVCLWDLVQGRLKDSFNVATTVMTVAFSPDGQLIAVGDISQTLSIRQVETGTLVTLVKAHYNAIYGLAFSPDSKLIVSGSYDSSIKIWDVNALHGSVKNERLSHLRELEGHNDSVFSVSFTPDAQLVISGSKDKSIQLWDAATGKAQLLIMGHTDTVTEVAASPQAGQFATASGDGKVRIWSYRPVNSV
ncbi:hypothetical protein IL306_004298 [Fusarium sp. DS 682]|nr:hypothetical protein IL306_004298 [Fusarium sp. DS 682]